MNGVRHLGARRIVEEGFSPSQAQLRKTDRALKGGRRPTRFSLAMVFSRMEPRLVWVRGWRAWREPAREKPSASHMFDCTSLLPQHTRAKPGFAIDGTRLENKDVSFIAMGGARREVPHGMVPAEGLLGQNLLVTFLQCWLGQIPCLILLPFTRICSEATELRMDDLQSERRRSERRIQRRWLTRHMPAAKLIIGISEVGFSFQT